MKKLVVTAIAAALSVAMVAGCASKEQTGAVIGGLAGGLLGSQFGGGNGQIAAVLVGTLAGTMIGSSVGRYMDQQDEAKLAQSLEYDKTNQTSGWTNPDTGNSYQVTPTQTTFPQSAQGQPCREFTMTANIGGKPQETYGTACRQADGSWKIVQ
jgi:surface antigen